MSLCLQRTWQFYSCNVTQVNMFVVVLYVLFFRYRIFPLVQLVLHVLHVLMQMLDCKIGRKVVLFGFQQARMHLVWPTRIYNAVWKAGCKKFLMNRFYYDI
uniref:Uncharacterized protein n=1 Tax=Setaria viridis TaxID=4556 RepID=A0A4U6UWI3_SETVI|nr:hypothetical protein SEVIR_5G443100v2 [Setaria viridis]